MQRNILNINILLITIFLTITLNVSSKIFVSAALHQEERKEEKENNSYYLNKKDEYQYPILGFVNTFISPAIATTNNINTFNNDNIKKSITGRTHSTATIAKGKPLLQKSTSEKAVLRSRKNIRGDTRLSAYSDSSMDLIPSDSSMDFGDDDGKYASVENFDNPNPSYSNSFFPKEVTSTMDEEAPGDTKSEYTPKANDYFIEDRRPIVLFDGVCNFCNEGVTTILKLDTKEHLRFAALQSDAGKTLLTTCGRETNDISSIVLVTKEGKCYTKSEAIAKIGAECDVPVAALSSLSESMIPEFIRDSLYDQIAANRYNIFGKRDQLDCRKCDEMGGKYNDRFVQ